MFLLFLVGIGDLGGPGIRMHRKRRDGVDDSTEAFVSKVNFGSPWIFENEPATRPISEKFRGTVVMGVEMNCLSSFPSDAFRRSLLEDAFENGDVFLELIDIPRAV
jgi:hypothetical protein